MFDAAATYSGTSLNWNLKGPDSLSSLNSVLMRFWEGHFAIMVDIKDMFYEVKVLIKDIGFIGSCCTQTPGYLITNISCRLFNFGKTDSWCCAKWALKSRALKYSPEVLGTFTWMTVWINSPSLEQPVSVIANVMQLLKSSWFILSLF